MAGNSGKGLLEGITTLVEKLAELAEKGDQLQRSGEFSTSDKGVKGMYGLNLRIGGADLGPSSSIPRVQPVARPAAPTAPTTVRRTRQTAAQSVREPLVDIFEEESEVLVVAELPGVDDQDIRLDLNEDILTFHAERGPLEYHKEVRLPKRFTRDQMHFSYRNGVLEIRFKAEEAPG